MVKYYSSVFVKSKYKTAKQKGIQATDYHTSYATKSQARQGSLRKIAQEKLFNSNAKHLKFSAHVVTQR